MHDSHSENKFASPINKKLVLVGNPNVGKSVVFSNLTGQYATVSNYPGTTVEVFSGTANIKGERITVIDTPGVNSLIPQSEDEKVTRDILLEENMLIVQVADAKNLKRTILLTLQLIELDKPVVLVLNMMDELKQRRIEIDTLKLFKLLGIPVVEAIAIEGKGIPEIKEKIDFNQPSQLKVNYGEKIEEALAGFEQKLDISRGICLMFLAFDKGIEDYITAKCGENILAEAKKIREEVQALFSRDLGNVINEIRNKKAKEIADQAIKFRPKTIRFAQVLGDFMLKPVFGSIFLLLVIFLMYKFVGEFAAQTGVAFFEEKIFGKFINPFIITVVKLIFPAKIFQEIFIGEYGIVTMALTYAFAIVLPIISAFFLFFSLLEDSGYLPRLAILLNRSFRIIGLSGKAVIPMVLGLGCDTMATITTRTLETRKERIISTLLLALAIPCSAQLGVILGMISGLSSAALFIWIGVVSLVMLVVGFLAAKIIQGNPADFILEIPPLRIPKISNILIKTIARLEWYIKEAVPLFILGTLILFVLNKLQVLMLIEKITNPLVVGFLGLPPKATEAFLIGFLRRDYGAAGLFALSKKGMLTPNQIIVSLVTITLFVPCIAQFMVMIKERGVKTAIAITAFVFPFAFFVGGVLNFVLNYFRIKL